MKATLIAQFILEKFNNHEMDDWRVVAVCPEEGK